MTGRVAARGLAWSAGFAVVVALAIAGDHILVSASEKWSYPSRLAEHGRYINSTAQGRVGIVAGIVAGLALLVGLPFFFLRLAWGAYRHRAGKA
ncbi:hypothetical protein [Actinomadura sp. 3N508]|uniref:hypothetical protein n=1 Tax=Actinomadura sp. 3N508 TaxID=3375153 RepID=UPI0037AB8B1B